MKNLYNRLDKLYCISYYYNNMIDKKTKILRALGHPARLMMAKGLMSNECHVDKIVKKLKLPQSTVSQHLGVLKSAGIIKGERRGVKVCYRVVDPLAQKLLELL